MSLADETDIQRYSVTKDDAEVLNPGGKPNVLWVTFPQQYFGGPTGVLPPDLPLPWSRQRDLVLITTVLHETMWSAAVQKAIAKMITLGFTVKDQAKSERRTLLGQNRLLRANGGRGWSSFLWQHLSDYLLTDNGAFVELVYKTSDVRSQFLGFQHLDSARCTRTGDTDIPVVYEDLRGRVHEVRAHQVLTFVDMESGRAEARGTGMCAASRAYPTIQKMAGLERYVSEKITGSNQKEIHIVNGISAEQVNQGLRSADEGNRNRGMVFYKGVALITATAMNAAISGYKIPIAEIPDGFSSKEERDNAYLLYSNVIGMPLTDIQPLSGQGLGTGKQSEIIDDSEEKFGLPAWGKDWEHKANDGIMPTTTTFSWSDRNDSRKQRATAEVSKLRAETRGVQVQTGEITPQQALQLAADTDDVPQVFLEEDETPNDSLGDGQKPITDAAIAEQQAMDAGEREAEERLETEEREPAPRRPRPPVTTKARRDRLTADALFGDAAMLAAAQRLAEEVRG